MKGVDRNFDWLKILICSYKNGRGVLKLSSSSLMGSIQKESSLNFKRMFFFIEGDDWYVSSSHNNRGVEF